MNVAAGQVGDAGVGRNSLGARDVNYRICRLGYFTNRPFADGWQFR
jgi:CDGSH-type Zn-finger protein